LTIGASLGSWFSICEAPSPATSRPCASSRRVGDAVWGGEPERRTPASNC